MQQPAGLNRFVSLEPRRPGKVTQIGQISQRFGRQPRGIERVRESSGGNPAACPNRNPILKPGWRRPNSCGERSPHSKLPPPGKLLVETGNFSLLNRRRFRFTGMRRRSIVKPGFVFIAQRHFKSHAPAQTTQESGEPSAAAARHTPAASHGRRLWPGAALVVAVKHVNNMFLCRFCCPTFFAN